MSEDDTKKRLAELDARIRAAKSVPDETPHQEEHYSQAQVAWRMVTEMVSGLGLGFGIGYGLDSLFGTLPWLMVIFTFLGLAAGINVMMRTAKEIQAHRTGDAPTETKRDDYGD